MKINNPRLFNGQLLASYAQIAEYLSGSFAFTEDVGFSGKIDTAFIPISGIPVVDNNFAIYADTIKLSAAADAKTIAAKFEEIQGAINAVKQYSVTTGDNSGISVAKTTATVDGIATDTFTVSIAENAFQIKKLDAAEGGNAATYQLTGPDGKAWGQKINIPKDQFLSGAVYVPSAEVLRFTFHLPEDGSNNVVDIPVGDLVDEYSAGAGITITDNVDGKNIISVNKSTLTDSEDFFFVDSTGVGVSGIQAAINTAVDAKALETLGTVSGKYSQIVNCSAIPTQEQLQTSEYDVDTLLVTDDGETAIVVVNENGNKDLIKISKEVATTGADIANGSADNVATAGAVKAYVSDNTAATVSAENAAKLPTVSAVSSYVGDIKTATDASIATLSATLTSTRELAVEFVEVQAAIGTGTTATVSGRVIAVYDADGEQCYPTITWDKTAKTSTLSIDATVATYDIIYSKVIAPAQEG